MYIYISHKVHKPTPNKVLGSYEIGIDEVNSVNHWFEMYLLHFFLNRISLLRCNNTKKLHIFLSVSLDFISRKIYIKNE